MALRTEIYDESLFIYSVEQEQENEDASAVGIASVIEKQLSDGSMYTKVEFEIKPHCPANEREIVKSMLLKHISR